MTRNTLGLIVNLLCLLGIASSASATSFGAFATSPLTLNAVKTVSVGDTFTVDIGFILDPGDSISSYAMSIMFDTDLGNELQFISASQPGSVTGLFGGPLTPTGTPVGVDSTGSSAGSVITFAGSTTPGTGIVNSGATPFDVVIGTITFKALAGVTTDGADAFTGFFDGGDHLTDNSGAPHSHALTFGDLSVNLVPEPGTFSLVALGMFGLSLKSRRERLRS